MGLSNSKNNNIVTENLKLDSISTVSMALDEHRQQNYVNGGGGRRSVGVKQPAAPGATGALNRTPPPSTASSLSSSSMTTAKQGIESNAQTGGGGDACHGGRIGKKMRQAQPRTSNTTNSIPTIIINDDDLYCPQCAEHDESMMIDSGRNSSGKNHGPPGYHDDQNNNRIASSSNRNTKTMDSRPQTLRSNIGGEEATPIKRKSSRKSTSIGTLFRIDLFVLLLVFAGTFLLRFTDLIGVVHRNATEICTITSAFRYAHERDDHNSRMMFAGISEWIIYILILVVPIVMIILVEIVRLLTQNAMEHDPGETIDTDLMSVPLIVRRILRFLGGFLLGLFITSIVVDILKLQTGEFRPYTLIYCPDICSNDENVLKNSKCLGSKEMIMARKSFPSFTSATSIYVAVFMAFYLTAALNYRGLRMIRFILIAIIGIFALLLARSRMDTNYNHPEDVIFGSILGAIFALYIVFYYLNSFANRLSTTNLFTAKNRQDIESTPRVWYWPSFRIPRVGRPTSPGVRLPRTDNRQSSDVHRISDEVTTTVNRNRNVSGRPNSYINPAFDDISGNRLTWVNRIE